ncbi:hypothetical protein LCGC14_0094500 [marine sediment metagenome]|uniref:4-hydroxy-tetrahydrodipicolinate synthase n=1 Tax=marine sediment metagenome TaxID=412755 RepID=A0A0F9VHI4_9ZZZZ|nr:4-hydroxy-tetrahydrodipicolinate synthase [Phycisphaerae bacterium]HDZ45229.1 4-hydroxy-tetrahydrodipicolinate synthase [Phycisphaerae bacterium]
MANPIQLEGSMVALVTPFAGGEVDYETLGKLIDMQIEAGTMGLVPCGTTGESPTLSHDEHNRVVAFTVEHAAGRAIVIAGTGSNSTAEAVRLTEHAESVGADACLVVNPYYNKPPQRGMFDHIQRLAEAELPIVLYNIPGRTSIELTVETMVAMYEKIDMVVAVKEATGKLDVASGLAAACDITILSGDDSLTLPIGAVGGRGVISVLANILPGKIRKLCDAILRGDMADATARHVRLFPLFKGIFVETNPIPIKALMAMAGLIGPEIRLPLAPLADEHRPKLAAMLKTFRIEAKL